MREPISAIIGSETLDVGEGPPAMWTFPPPKTWQRFEELLADWAASALADPSAARYGRNGQRQHGIDILARDRRVDAGAVWGIQARRLEERAPGRIEAQRLLQEAVEHLQVDVFVLATTTPPSTALQDWAVEAERREHEAGRATRVEVWFWDALAERLYAFPWFREKYLRPLLPERDPGIRADRAIRIPEQRWQPDVSPPGALLLAQHEVVPFHGRAEELAELQRWRDETRPAGVWLVTGRGGIGKTRLALEACQRAHAAGWRAGFVNWAEADPSPDGWSQILRSPQPLMVVADYAETYRARVEQLLVATRAAEAGPVRVLLLARGASAWWEQLKASSNAASELLRGPASRHLRLEPVAPEVADREASHALAGERFAAALGLGWSAETPHDLGDPLYERILFVHMRALASVEGVVVRGEDGLLDFALDRERRFWSELAQRRGIEPTIAAGIGKIASVITRWNGIASPDEGRAIAAAIPHFADQPRAVVDAVLELLHDSYPGSLWVEAVAPDLLGEHLIEKEIEADPDLLDVDDRVGA